MTPNSQGYQPSMGGPEMMGRMGPYESNKDPFGGMRKGKRGGEAKRFCETLGEHKPEHLSGSSWRTVHAAGAQQRDGRAVQQGPAGAHGQHADGPEAAVPVRVRPKVSVKRVPPPPPLEELCEL